MMAQSATELERFSLARYEQAMAVVAHELRTPLNAISMAAQRMELAADPASTKVGEFLSRSARTMSRLVEDLLLYSKLEADRFSIHAVTVDVREVVREACEVLQALARRRGVDIAASIPDTAVSCVCDHDRILQALGNLVSNAIRFTPKGGLVRVELEPQAERCVFRVADTGPGISADHIEHIFRPFWQAPGATQGAGLGLAIARGIVEAHGGEIAAEHSARPGAVFTFWLPNEGSPKASASLPAAAPP
ncbi:MAG TPA: HAMP domain-containing sensor histidine kinase [Polyangiaceae bacterium]